MIDPYIILGIRPDEATDELVAERAKAIIKENHPDKHAPDLSQPEKEAMTVRFMEAKEAWDLLRTAEDRENWEKGITKKGMNEFLMTLVQEYTKLVLEMSVTGMGMNPKKRLKEQYATAIGHLAKKKQQTETTLGRFEKNMKKVKVSEEDPLYRSLMAQKGMIETEVKHIESMISAMSWKLNYLKKNYDWTDTEWGQSQYLIGQLTSNDMSTSPWW